MTELASDLDVNAVLGIDGVIRDQIKDFSTRDSQLKMAQLIADAIEDREGHIIEASTGIGKSFAYLVPVFLSNKKVIISTGTKNLQDQLFFKDIPLIRKTIVNARKTALLKGRSNYCCPHRIKQYKQQKQFQKREMASLFAALSDWSLETASGDISEFSAIPENDPIWFYATSNADNCLGSDCPEFSSCFVAKARKKAMNADIVVINHHLFFSDTRLKEDGFGEILPEAEVLIFDEAHQLPDIASHFYGEQLSMRQIELLCRDMIEAELSEAGDSRQLQIPADKLCQLSADFRLELGQFPSKSDWSKIQNAPRIKQSLSALQDSLDELLEKFEPMTSRGKDLASCYRRLEALNNTLQQFLDPSDSQVNWYEWHDRSFRLVLSPLEINDLFRQQLDRLSFESIFFTSATLSSQQSFRYFSHRMGLEGFTENRFESPFDYQKQALLYIPDDLPDPSGKEYARCFGQRCIELIKAADGYCFILFTSYRMLSWTADYFNNKINNPLFVQGEYQRSELLNQYLKSRRGVLLGTSSFWEGVDVKGDQLRCVIIDKLPFKSPGDPVYKKRLQQANKQGGNAFTDIQIPEATISLRQGVGRLIRDENDQGIVVLCDNRLNSKPYGKAMIDSLPDMKITKSLDDVEVFVRRSFS